jgi:hypothetical protein
MGYQTGNLHFLKYIVRLILLLGYPLRIQLDIIQMKESTPISYHLDECN